VNTSATITTVRLFGAVVSFSLSLAASCTLAQPAASQPVEFKRVAVDRKLNWYFTAHLSPPSL